MKENPYVVRRSEGRWAIQVCGRMSDTFDDRDDAVLTAIIRAENDRRQGRRIKVLVEENGRARAVWGDGGDAMSGAPRGSRRGAPLQPKSQPSLS